MIWSVLYIDDCVQLSKSHAYQNNKRYIFLDLCICLYSYILPVAVETPRILQAHSTTIHQMLSEFPMISNLFPLPTV